MSLCCYCSLQTRNVQAVATTRCSKATTPVKPEAVMQITKHSPPFFRWPFPGKAHLRTRQGGLVLQSLVLIALPSCVPRVGVLHHSEGAAASQAQKFADAAFVQRDFKKAYALCAPETRA